MSANKWTQSEIWAWYSSVNVDKYKLGRKKSDLTEDKYNIRLRAVVNGNRLIIGCFQGCAGVRIGVYYMTPGANTNVCTDGKYWHSGKFEYVALGGYTSWGCSYNYNYRFVSGASEAESWLTDNFGSIVRRYHGADVIDYIGSIESTTSSRRRIEGIRRKRDRINTWLKDMPPVPDDFGTFIDNTVFCGMHYAFGKKGADTYTCSVCAKKFIRKDMKHGKYYECSSCGARVKCEKKKDQNHFYSRVTLIQSYHDIKGQICSIKREMYVNKRYNLNGETIRLSEGSLIVLPLNGGRACSDDIYFYGSCEWSDKNTWGFQHSKGYCYPDVSALEGTGYDKRSIEAAARAGWCLNYNTLMRWYYDEPRMEYLIKCGLYGLVLDLTTNFTTAHLMPGEDIKSVLGLDGNGVARLKANGGGVIYLAWLRTAFMCGYRLPEKVIQYFCKRHIMPNEASVPLNSGASPEQVVNYIEKQRKLCGSSADYILTTWRDTLNMTKNLKVGGGSYTLFPKNVKRRHAELCGIRDIELHKSQMQSRLDGLEAHVNGIAGEIQNIEKRYPRVADVCGRVKATFEWSDGEYSVIVPTGISDVLVEGYLLGHCIARPKHDGTYLYFERIECDESYVCFLRKNSEITSPWYTMEVEPGGDIRQLRTFGDDEGADREEAKKFLRKWRKKVKSRLGKSEIKAAEISREKRLQEFAELRRGQNKIYGGKLAGLLLVDVLEADFNEFNADDFEESA